MIEDGHRESTASLANRSGIMAEKKHQLTALGIAYEAVIKLGYTHSKLVNLNEGVNFPTLRNIRDGKELKKVTERFYLKLFFDLLNKEYELRMTPVSYTHLTLPTNSGMCRSRWSPYH